MNISGHIPQSLVEFPGNISAVIFTQGCNLRCGFCHNKELIEKKKGTFNTKELLKKISDNKLLDAVVITGGEPTLQEDIIDFCNKIKKLKPTEQQLKIKLDTNGTDPEKIRQLIPFIDHIAMDIKTVLDFHRYNEITGNTIDKKTFQNILKSISLIIESKIPHTFRTTAIKEFHTDEELKELEKELGNLTIQKFIPENCMDTRFQKYSSLL
jgi:pyruvate formate lyase activating enzyme